MSVLEAELDRSRRTRRPFSVVLLDMDGLKIINDQYGHLTGSRALVRISKILRNHSRAIDTAARYGGDEFALVLPEAGKDIASRVVSRIRERLSAEPEHPPLSVSAGVAAFPEDGDSPEKLLGCIGYLLPEKGQEIAIHALSRLRTKIPATRLLLAGDGPCRPALEALVQRLGMRDEVICAGFVGARVVSARRWQPGETLVFASRTGEFRSSGRVAYCQPLQGEGFAIGVEFLEPKGRWVVQSPR
ncbi:MAG: hypothetical protein DMG46_26585 [Acidobacteria bacterium]|nr:MAG: hypothetical protein DMG46_26585 [Acidobacteriota bacterium]